MLETKLKLCREFLDGLPPNNDDQTAKHLLAAVEIAENLFVQNNRLEMEARVLRLAIEK